MSISNSNTKTVEEITIAVPWGHVSGKWWGPKTIRPIVALHGWQDNAGTFDRLIPLLPNDQSYFALDFPGHGLSSKIPDGQKYDTYRYLYALHLIFDKFNWDKVSILAHSMGSASAFIYAACFPDKIDMFIGLDYLKPDIRSPENIYNQIRYSLIKGLATDLQNQWKTEPPSYFEEELVDIFLKKRTRYPLDRSTAPYLIKRMIKPSKIYPEKYYFNRDSRLKVYGEAILTHDVALEMARRITMPYCFIQATETNVLYKKYYEETIDVMQQNNSKFELHKVDGDHHVHLSSPTIVSGIIINFINKYRPLLNKL